MAHNPHSIVVATGKSFRGVYFKRFLIRCAVFVAAFVLFFVKPDQFDVMLGLNFFRHFSIFHLLWIAWMFDMVMQLIPSAGYWPLGSQKYFGNNYVPITKRINIRHLKQVLTPKHLAKILNRDTLENVLQYINKDRIAQHINKARLVDFIKTSTRDAYYIAIVWILMIIGLATLFKFQIIDYKIVMLISIGFYLSDVICVYFWCPFRVFFMHNRCCTTCRIFNWDHLMMFSPFIFIPGVFTWTLALMAIVIFVLWEVTFFVHPERFWDETNAKLTCRNCTDELCGRRLMVDDIEAAKDEIVEKISEIA